MRPLRVLLAATLIMLGVPAGALAHGDGPTNILASADLYPALSSPPTSTVERQLMGYVLAAQRVGVPVKVAIATEADVTDHAAMVRQPQVYAEHVTRRIESEVPVIIVTPYGVGMTGTRARAHAEVPLHASSDALAGVAMEAVRTLTKAAGHPLPANVPLAPKPPAGSGVAPASSSGDARGWLPFAVFGAVFGGAALFFEVRQRLRRRRHSSSTHVMVTEGP